MRRAIIILSLIILLLVPFLSACDSGDMQQLIYWAKLWAIVHDITDEDGSPNLGAITRFAVGETFGIGTTGDKEGDAAIDAGRVLKNIKEAEESADQGWEALYKGQNIKEYVLPHYDQAVKMRPDDWSYRNGRGIANLEDLENPDNANAARADFDKANALAKKSGKPAEYLRMLKNREQAMARLVTHENEIHAYPTKDVYLEQSRTYDELYKLTNDKTYLLLKQQADTNLQEGHYWQRDTGS